LSIDLDQARELVQAAKAGGVRVGCAPDTFMGQGIQTAIATLDSGVIGDVVGATAAMRSPGPERWHPSPEFFFKRGGGPMLDMGPYYLTALTALLGPAKRTAGLVRASFPVRTVGSGPLKGSEITVETPTHVAGVIEYASGPLAELTTSFDVYHGWGNAITIYGSKGTMRVPDPNNFKGDVMVRGSQEDEWSIVEPKHAYGENSRGLGVLDIALAIQEGRPHRASGDLALHVLETMLSFEKSSTEGRHVALESSPERPAPMPTEGLE
jgi:predicted dehydrogenase